MIGNFGWTEVLVIGGIIVLFFGAKRIPDIAKSLGQGLRAFKGELQNDSASGSKKTH